MLIKLGEALSITNIENPDSVTPLLSEEILNDFRKTAANFKKIAPRAEDFLYFSAVMMHAAEAAAINDDGSPKLTKSGTPVEVGWDVKNGSWKWKSNDPNIKPYKNCFIPGTKILMHDGSVKNIEDVVAGDFIITHKGNIKKVLRTFTTPHNDKMYDIKINNLKSLITTSNHKLYTLTVSNKNWKCNPNVHRIWKEKNTTKNFEFIETKNLSKDHILLCPTINKEINDSTLNLNKARLLGLYAAEGSLVYNNKKEAYKVIFTIGSHEEDNILNTIKTLISSEYPNCSVVNYKYGSKLSVSVKSKEFANLCLKYVGVYSGKKSLRDSLVYSPYDIKQQFILGWLEGDGSIDKYSKKVVGVTASPSLANQIRMMLLSMQIPCSMHERKPYTSYLKNGNIIEGKLNTYLIKLNSTYAQKIIKDSNKLVLNKTTKNRNLTKFEQGYFIHKILGISEIDYNGYVYNLEVEDDNSYIANGVAVSNCNGDIFPEAELIKAYKKWIGKPLCIDHQSSSIDHVRGFIVDTYYDRNLKRVVALCALDKKNYPELARKVATGYSNSVSMGTGVAAAICYDCGQIARAEKDFCNHMRTKSCYGEINTELNPIELSIVVNGADGKAKIKHIIAAKNALAKYVVAKEKEFGDLQRMFSATFNFHGNDDDSSSSKTLEISSRNIEDFEKSVNEALNEIKDLNEEVDEADQELLEQSILDDKESATDSASDLEDASSIEELETSDKNQAMALGVPSANKYAIELKKSIAGIENKLNQIKQDLQKFANKKEELNMSQNKKAYYQGAGGENEPTPGEKKYPIDPLNEKVRETGDKQMIVEDTGPVDGLFPGDLEKKKMLARAEAEERSMRRQAVVALAKKAIEERNEEQLKAVAQSTHANELSQLVNSFHKTLVNATNFANVNDKQTAPFLNAVLKQLVAAPSFDKKAAAVAANASKLESLGDKYAELVEATKAVMQQFSAMNPKLGYFQGGGGVNEPTPGKPKYAPDKLNTEVREKGDKQMVGAKPFPDVGPVDGMYPGDKDLKESLKRASYKARFVKNAEDLGDSKWEVYYGDKLILQASVDELTGNRSDFLFESVATKEFGSKLLERVKTAGANKVVQMFKAAQEPPAPAPQPAPAAPEAAPAMPEAAPADANPMAGLDEAGTEDKQDVGELAEKVKDLASELAPVASDLKEAVNGLLGEQAQMGETTPKQAALLSPDLLALQAMRKELNASLTSTMKEAVANLEDHIEELDTLSGFAEKGIINSANASLVTSLAEDAIAEAKTALANGMKLMAAFVKYAQGSESIVKRAQMEMGGLESKMDEPVFSERDDAFNAADEDEEIRKLLEQDAEESLEHDMEDELDADVTVKTPAQAAEVAKTAPEGTEVKVEASFDLTTKEGRAQMRAKLAADSLKVSPVLDEAHPKGGFTTELDVKPSDDLAKVEDLKEVQKKMLDIANAPPKVRKQAEKIHQFVSEGKLDKNDVDSLVAEGVDKDAVAYYKKFYGQVEGGSEFASEMLKEHTKAQMEKELNGYKVKMARAYDLAYSMVERGLCGSDRESISDQVEQIMAYNPEAFESLKRVVAMTPTQTTKTASSLRIPLVGSINTGESNGASADSDDINSLLTAAFSKSTRRMF